jgi:hypothetical protein
MDSVTYSTYRQPRKSGPRTKFGNRPSKGYQSRKEMRHGADLRLLEASGEISDLREQVKFELIPKQDGERAVTYIADFTFLRDGKLVVEDVKSEPTRKLAVYILKRKLMLFVHGIRIVEV